jgi:hypothetical protein
MIKYLQIIVFLLAPVLGLAQNTVTVSTDREKYLPSDTITVTFTYWNKTDTTTLLQFTSSCQYNFCVDNSWCWGDDKGCATVLTSVSIPPYSTHTWTCRTPAADFTIGSHSLQGWIGEIDSTQGNYGGGSTSFTVRVNEVIVSTDKPTYQPGDTITVTITYCNNTDTTTSLFFPMGCQFDFAVDSTCAWCSYGCTANIDWVTIPPHDEHAWQVIIPANYSVGIHSIIGWIGGVDTTHFPVHGIGRTTFTIDSLFNSQFTVTVNIVNGWNMISLPLLTLEVNKNSLFPENASNAFSFDKGYKSSDILQHGTGYWLKFAGARSITIEGNPLLVDTIDVTPGWQMIGSLSVPVPRSSITSIPAGIISIARDFNYYGGNHYLLDTLIRPGKAYWIKISGAGKIILDGRK